MSDYDLVILSEEIKIYYVHGLIYLLYLGELPQALSQLCPPIVTNVGSDMTLEQLNANADTELGLFGSSAVVKFDGRTIFELKSGELLVIEQLSPSKMVGHTINWNGEMTMFTKKGDGYLCLSQRARSDILPKKHLIILRHKKT